MSKSATLTYVFTSPSVPEQSTCHSQPYTSTTKKFCSRTPHPMRSVNVASTCIHNSFHKQSNPQASQPLPADQMTTRTKTAPANREA